MAAGCACSCAAAPDFVCPDRSPAAAVLPVPAVTAAPHRAVWRPDTTAADARGPGTPPAGDRDGGVGGWGAGAAGFENPSSFQWRDVVYRSEPLQAIMMVRSADSTRALLGRDQPLCKYAVPQTLQMRRRRS
jgi:hypothetical protein